MTCDNCIWKMKKKINLNYWNFYWNILRPKSLKLKSKLLSLSIPAGSNLWLAHNKIWIEFQHKKYILH